MATRVAGTPGCQANTRLPSSPAPRPTERDTGERSSSAGGSSAWRS
ncbi:hypothetical protein EYF80_063702 [Liparis tanakae]|uniref:Uncharacterized protein n=1 Tax=Liparis tanakae TaxID=230148 RepID=A0A4Z2EBN3_9TELE|nr:hypothetical protein EYF80_063702 [Liparis tanakae]